MPTVKDLARRILERGWQFPPIAFDVLWNELQTPTGPLIPGDPSTIPATPSAWRNRH